MILISNLHVQEHRSLQAWTRTRADCVETTTEKLRTTLTLDTDKELKMLTPSPALGVLDNLGM